MFKVGDRVICVRREYGNETVGKIYVVSKAWEDDVCIELDDNGNPNYYKVDQFKKVTSKPKAKYADWEYA